MKSAVRLCVWLCFGTILLGTLSACQSTGISNETSEPSSEPALTLQADGETTAETLPDTPPPPGEDYDLSTNLHDRLPRMDIRTANGKMDFATAPNRTNKWDYTDCTVTVTNCDAKYRLDNIDAGIKVRGNYTADYEKKPFRIKFDVKQGMLGLNDGAKCKSWVLLADWKDSSMLRNAVACYLGNALLGSDGYYCSDFCNVELYLNGQYWGMYLLVEQQQVNDERVDVYESEGRNRDTDIGYLVEYDAYFHEEPALNQFTFKRDYPTLRGMDGQTVRCGQKGYSIKSDIYHNDQKEFIAAYIENVFQICYNAAYKDQYYSFNSDFTAIRKGGAKSAEEAITAVLDVDSLVDMYILQEIACDYDIAWSSFFMSVDMSEGGSKKLVFEAPWDFDSAFGLKDACRNGNGYFAANKDNPWLLLLIHEDWFMDRVKAKWQDASDAGVFDGALDMIRAYQRTYADEYAENYRRWPNLGMNVGGELLPEAQGFRTQSEAADHLYQWLRVRLRYLDKQWGK